MIKIRYSKHKSFYKAAFGMSSMSAAALLISFVGSVILTRTVGAEGRGIIAWFVASSSLTATFMQFGLETVNRKYISRKPELANGLLTLSQNSISIAFLILSPLYVVFCVSSDVGSKHIEMVVTSTICIYFMAITPAYGGVLLGLHKIKPVAYSGVLMKSVNTVLIISLLITNVLTPESALLALLISHIFSFTILKISLRRSISGDECNWKKNILLVRKYATINYLVLIFSISLISSTPLLLNYFSSAREAGLFSACYIITDAITKVMGNISHYALPKISSIKSDSESSEFRNGLLIFMSFSIIIVAVFWFLIAEYTIPFLFGYDFSESIQTFNVLLIAMIFTTIGSTIYSFLLSSRNDYFIALPPFLGLIFTLAFSIYYIPIYGSLGGAISVSIGAFFNMGTSICLYKNRC